MLLWDLSPFSFEGTLCKDIMFRHGMIWRESDCAECATAFYTVAVLKNANKIPALAAFLGIFWRILHVKV